MKLIKKIDEEPKKKDAEGNDVVIENTIQLELENRLEEEVDMDLHFKLGHEAYEKTFKRNWGFSNAGEMAQIQGLIEKLAGYDEADQRYIIHEGINNALYIKNLDTAEETYVKMDAGVKQYLEDILQWMRAQEKYGAPTS